jgi:hypothetical protein
MIAQASGTCYLLCIQPPYFHAAHYAGWTIDSDPARRVAEHLAGQGSPLIRAAVAAGRRIDLVLSVPGDRGLERRFHNRHGTRVCPRCCSQHLRRPRQLRLPIRKGAAIARPRLAFLWRLAHAA